MIVLRRSNKKLLIAITIFLVIDLLIISFVKENILDNGLNFKVAEEKYLQTQSNEDLLVLANELLQTQRYNDIVEYYPEFLIAIPNMTELALKSDIWAEDRDELDENDIINIYIFTYLNAVFEKNGKHSFEDEFEKYSHFIKFVEKNNEVETLGVLQLYFTNKLGQYSSGVNKNKTSAFLEQFSKLWNESEHLEHYDNYFYHFCSKWYSNIVDMDNYNKTYPKITKPYVAILENEIELPNNYVIVYSNEYDSNILGVRGYGIYAFLEISENINAYATKEHIVVVRCVEKNMEKFFIVDTNQNTVSAKLDINEYESLAKELGLEELQFELVSDKDQSGDAIRGETQSGDGSMIES